MIQLLSRRLCPCHCLCISLCLCICVPYSFLNCYYHKLSENVWVWGSRGSRSGDLVGCYHSGTDERTNEQKGKINNILHNTFASLDFLATITKLVFSSESTSLSEGMNTRQKQKAYFFNIVASLFLRKHSMSGKSGC